MTASHDEPEDLPETATASGTAGGAAPRMARYGEEGEGRPARRARGGTGGPRDSGGPRGGFFARAGRFLRDVRAEVRRTTWPTGVGVRHTRIIPDIAGRFLSSTP